VAKGKKNLWLIAVFLLFVVYFFAAARQIPLETVLKARWLCSLESDTLLVLDDSAAIPEGEEAQADPSNTLPFTLAGHFGYMDSNGRFTINQIKEDKLSLSGDRWAQYKAEPAGIEIRNNVNEVIETIENPRGYPFFLDSRSFILGVEQNALSETDGNGSVLWTYQFAAPILCADAAGGMVLAGSLDGLVELLDSDGKQIFSFEPGGSRYTLILACAFSRAASRFAIICGIEEQRFLLFERYGKSRGEYKVVYHEFLGDGFRRPLHIAFIDSDRRIVFEREGGICVFDINARKSYNTALEGEVTAIDQSGGGGQFFVIVNTNLTGQKKLVGLNLPQKIFVKAPFKSDDIFLGRSGSRLFVGGRTTLASFELEKE
jgi:hypothetical protein